jgi:hypothetical protein
MMTMLTTRRGEGATSMEEAMATEEAPVKQGAREDRELDWSVYPTRYEEEDDYTGCRFPHPAARGARLVAILRL